MDCQAVSVEEPGRDPSLVPGNLTCDGGRFGGELSHFAFLN